MKTLLLIAFLIVPFCDTITSQSVSHPELKAVSERMWNDHGSSNNLSHCDSFLDILDNAIGGNWNLMEKLLNLADQMNSVAYINVNYEAVWLLLQRDTTMLHSKIIFQFATYVEKNVHLKKEFKKNVMMCALSEAALFLPELFYPTKGMDIHLKNAIFGYLNALNHTALEIMFHQLYDNLLSKRSVLSIANKLFMLPFSNEQLTVAYMELASCNESRTDEAIEAISQNIEDLCVRDSMSLQEKILFKADTIHLKNVFVSDNNGKPFYMSMCRNMTSVCVSDTDRLNIHVERSRLSDDKSRVLCAFKIPGVGYISWKGEFSSITKEKMWWEVQIEKFILQEGRVLLEHTLISNSGYYLCELNEDGSVNPLYVVKVNRPDCRFTIELGV